MLIFTWVMHDYEELKASFYYRGSLLIRRRKDKCLKNGYC